MTYLELCQRLQQVAGVPGSAIPSVLNQRGELARLVLYVAQAWKEIQVERREWAFMWREFSAAVPSGASTYRLSTSGTYETFLAKTGSIFNLTMLPDDSETYTETTLFVDLFLRFGPGPLELRRTNGERRALQVMDALFLHQRTAGLNRSPGLPSGVTILPNNRLRFDCPLIEAVTVRGWLYRPVQNLTQNADVPMMPAQYHEAILYRALRKYADFEESVPLRQIASMNEEPWMQAMMREQLPKIVVGSSPLEGHTGYRKFW